MKRCLVLVFVSGTASAETPRFVSLDRASGSSSAGAHLGVMVFEDSNSDGGMPNLELPRLQLFGEYAVAPALGVMASTSVVAYRDGYGGDRTGLGTTHLGGYYRASGGDAEAVLRGGIVLPTTTFVPHGTYNEDVAVRGTLLPWLEE